MGKSFVYNDGKPREKKDELQLCFGLFFDGTGNNYKNTDMRIKYRNHGKDIASDPHPQDYTAQEQKAIDAQWNSDFAAEKRLYDTGNWSKIANPEQKNFIGADMDSQGATGSSFDNDYSNVARLYHCVDEDYKIYIEGIGTYDNAPDDTVGEASGSGKAGIRARVKLGCEKLADKISDAKKKKMSKQRITKITLDVFGFSRGAAAARNFCYEVNVNNDAAKNTVKTKTTDRYDYVGTPMGAVQQYRGSTQKMVDYEGNEVQSSGLVNGKYPRMGYLGYYLLSKGIFTPQEFEKLTLEVRFAGLYDTVASYVKWAKDKTTVVADGAWRSIVGSRKDLENNVADLHLREMGNVARIVHFTANDEHRENFPLSLTERGLEKGLPGVHSDIGGGYETGTETRKELKTAMDNKPVELIILNEFRNKIISEHWYKPDELHKKHNIVAFSWDNKNFGAMYSYLTGSRFLRKEYSYIPLHLMEQAAASYLGDKILQSRLPHKAYPIDGNKLLESVKSKLSDYVFEGKAYPFDEEELSKERKEKIGKAFDAQQQAYNPNAPVLDKIPPVKPPIVFDVEDYNDCYYLLSRLRHEYLHWSADYYGVGMDPTADGRRIVCYTIYKS